MNFLTYEFPVGKYPIGTQLDGIIQRYVKFSDGKEALILDNVHVIGQKPFPYTLQYAVSRTNAELVSRIYNTMENGIKALENAPMRLINLRYAVRGYGGIPHENTSWCRKCANVKLGDTSYFHEFSPFRDVIDHFLHNVGWFSGRREFA